ncbi:MAG TPA: cytochrome C biogenesis protein, partial [Methylophilaceae bacterium]|nr:cytochrome C biogenesis protein [Methylophilaceae bacterium]
MLEFLPYLITAGIYLVAAVEYWRKAKKTAPVSRWQWDFGIIAIGLALHGWLLYETMFEAGLNLGLTNALSAILWLTVLIYWLTD